VLICSERKVLLVAGGWFLREKYRWLVAGGWFLREKYCWLVADKPNEKGCRPGKQVHLVNGHSKPRQE
jgi:hypothetical protein